MKIFYAVQATGNGHISRAITLLPWLQQYGKVDIFLSGDNSHLHLDAPVKYRSKGISLYYNCRGGLHYWQILKNLEPLRIRKEISELPVEKYDVVLNDFDFITSAACHKKKVPSVHFGHQAAFQSPHTPRPSTKYLHGEWLLKHYVKATRHIGLHFKQYDNFIFPPVIKNEVLTARPEDGGFYVVYLPSYSEKKLREIFHRLPGYAFCIFSGETTHPRSEKNIRFMPVCNSRFTHHLVHCSGIITGAGFETPAEALHLGKKILVTPIRGQYEQLCNAAALQQMGITCLSSINEDFPARFEEWLTVAPLPRTDYSGVIPLCLEQIFSKATKKDILPQEPALPPFSNEPFLAGL